ncbi:histidinol dehydrogenase [Staphylococcus epidermidis]|nr:histidinol dehydrogenase [Staphylococcus epidermidis]
MVVPHSQGARTRWCWLLPMLAGVHRAFTIGAQAVAALAWHSHHPKVDKITGPGNA